MFIAVGFNQRNKIFLQKGFSQNRIDLAKAFSCSITKQNRWLKPTAIQNRNCYRYNLIIQNNCSEKS